jgi:endonuclease/exonuclease/phosphatase (EEP) superfamily protein YafD
MTISGMLEAGATIACVATLAGFGARLWWPLELCCHFRLQYFMALSLCSLAMAALRKKYWAVLFAGFALLNLAMIIPLYFGGGPPAPDLKSYRALLANVNTSNRAFGKAREFIRSSHPDIVVLLEVNDEWVKELQELLSEYPYHELRPRDDNFGMAVFSRLRPIRLEEIKIGRLGVPSVRTELDLDGRKLTIIAVHPLPPASSEYVYYRNEALEALAGLVAAQNGNVMVLGDLNMTSWSPYFGDLLQNAGLRDSRKGYGLQTTWPSLLVPLGITLDHCLVSPGIIITNRSVGPFIGSDHLPVIVDFSLSS